ncbi:MAG: shikimate kinase [Candidatus Riflebacteria bacterium]|nr:shikimate kinase [Candidatus Riflebacteria bacterium]
MSGRIPDRGAPAFYNHPISLIGFMAAGKTTVGSLLAEALGIRFIDLDEEIARREEATISELFEAFGEAGFRLRETEALVSVLESSVEVAPKPFVLACGGGIVHSTRNQQLLKTSTRCIFLDVPFECCQARLVLNSEERPLARMQTADELMKRYKMRLPLYRSIAHECIKASATPDSIVEKIVTALASFS